MHKVLGIGGVFFTAQDAGALGQWHAEHLGVAAPPPSYDDAVWRQEATRGTPAEHRAGLVS